MRRPVSPSVAIATAFLLRGFVQGPRIPGAVADVNVDPAGLGIIFFVYVLGNIAAFTIAARLIPRIGSPRAHMVFALPFALIVVVLSIAPGTIAFGAGIAPAQAVATVASIDFPGFLLGPLVIGAIADLASLRVAIDSVAAVLLGISVLTNRNPAPVPTTATAVRITRSKGEAR